MSSMKAILYNTVERKAEYELNREQNSDTSSHRVEFLVSLYEVHPFTAPHPNELVTRGWMPDLTLYVRKSEDEIQRMIKSWSRGSSPSSVN